VSCAQSHHSQAKPNFSRRRFVALALPLTLGLVAACSGRGESLEVDGALVARPAQDQWPDVFWRATPEVREAYRFALAHPDVLQYVPCYCGCVNGGHTSNRDCYIKALRPDGSVLLDPMSFA